MNFGRGEGFLDALDLAETEAIHHPLGAFLALFVGDCNRGGFNRLIVVVIVALIHEHERDIILRIEPPIAQPRPKAVIAVDSLYLIVVCRFGKKAAYLLPSAFFLVASSSTCASAASHLFSVCLTPSPIGFIESAS